MMLTLEIKTKLTPEEVNQKLRSFFGSEGYGLKLIDDCDGILSFRGGGGFVTARLCLEGKQTRLDLETREWEYAVKKFAEWLP